MSSSSTALNLGLWGVPFTGASETQKAIQLAFPHLSAEDKTKIKNVADSASESFSGKQIIEALDRQDGFWLWDIRSNSKVEWNSIKDNNFLLTDYSGNKPTIGASNIALSNSTLESLRYKISNIAQLPDAQGSTIGKGFTATGIFRNNDGTFWMANDGRSLSGDSSYEPSLVKVSSDGSLLLDEIDLGALIPGVETLQGIIIDNDGDIWVCAPNQNKIYNISTSGSLIGSLDITTPNGLAYDSVNDYLIYSNGTTIYIIQKNGTAVRNFSSINNIDHLYLDQATDRIYLSTGANGSLGRIQEMIYSTGASVQEFKLQKVLSIEGITKLDNSFYVVNNAYFHNTGEANELITFNLKSNITVSSFFVCVRGRFSGSSSGPILKTGETLLNPGVGLYFIGGDIGRLRLITNTSTGTSQRDVKSFNTISGGGTTTEATISAYVNLNTDSAEIWINGTSLGVSSLTNNSNSFSVTSELLNIGDAGGAISGVIKSFTYSLNLDGSDREIVEAFISQY